MVNNFFYPDFIKSIFHLLVLVELVLIIFILNLCICYLKAGSHYVALTVLKLTI